MKKNSSKKSPATRSTIPSDKDLILQLDKQWGQYASAGDVAKVVALYAKNGALVWPNEPVHQNTNAITEAWQGLIAPPNQPKPGIKFEFHSDLIVLAESNDLASDYGSVALSIPGLAPVIAKYVVVWQKIDGIWKVLYDSWNYNALPDSLVSTIAPDPSLQPFFSLLGKQITPQKASPKAAAKRKKSK